jgi:hypothetical protein
MGRVGKKWTRREGIVELKKKRKTTLSTLSSTFTLSSLIKFALEFPPFMIAPTT